MITNMFIAGTGLFAQVAALYFEKYTDYKIVAYACHQSYIKDKEINGLPVYALETITENFNPDNTHAFVAAGYAKMNKTRQKIYEEIKSKGYTTPSFVHPNVEIWDETEIGENVFIFEDNTIQPFTKIGNNTVLWSGNHVGHHSTIGDHCFISSHVVISGSCKLGNNIFIGVNASLRDGIKIANETLIGAGTTIMKDTKEKEAYVPNPSKPFVKNSEEIGF